MNSELHKPFLNNRRLFTASTNSFLSLPSLIAEDIINILKKDKKADASKGIIRETLGKFNPLEDKGFLKYIS